MGILKLMDFLRSKFPKCIRAVSPTEYSGKVIAVDASNTMYQFLVKTQTITRNTISTPTDWLGNKTGHLIGLLSRGLFCIENRMRPIWVFDGRPPAEKFKQLQRRKHKKEQAQGKSQEAEEQGDLMEALKQQQRSISISTTEKEDAIKMLRLMGMPVIEAPSEAEAQCAYLCKIGVAYGVVSEDMDTLTHGALHLIRNFNKRQRIEEIALASLLHESKLSMPQFVDLCILCGCDYTSRIGNVGPVRAYKLLQEHGDILHIVAWIRANSERIQKYPVAEDFNPIVARSLFTKANVKKEGLNLDWSPVDQERLKQFLTEKEFSSSRVSNWLSKATLNY